MSSGPGAPPALAVVIPAFRAARTIGAVVTRVRQALPAGTAVLVVDDGSGDETATVARSAGATVVSHHANQGKGRALATSLAAAVAAGAEIVVTMDADGQHPPEAVPTLVAALRAGPYDLVVGARERDERMPMGRHITNWLSSALVSSAVGIRVPDSQSGFRAMRREVAESVRPPGERYEFETEFLFLAAWRGYRIGAVRIPTVYDGAPSHFRYGGDTLDLARVFLRNWRGVLWGPGRGALEAGAPEAGTPEGGAPEGR